MTAPHSVLTSVSSIFGQGRSLVTFAEAVKTFFGHVFAQHVRRQELGVRCIGRVESGQCAAIKLDALRHVY